MMIKAVDFLRRTVSDDHTRQEDGEKVQGRAREVFAFFQHDPACWLIVAHDKV